MIDIEKINLHSILMKLDYGKDGIELKIDPNWNTKIIQPVEQLPIENPIEASL